MNFIKVLEIFPEFKQFKVFFFSIEHVSLRLFLFYAYSLHQLVLERILQPDSMAGDNSSGKGHARDDAQGMEVLRASLLTQETALRALVDSVDSRF